MKRHTLNAQIRQDVGKKVSKLRAEGKLPSTVYGKKVTSVSITVSAAEFESVYDTAGETGLIDLVVGKEVKPVLVHYVQRDPMRGTTLHVEFHQVDLKEKVKAAVPLVTVGESSAVTQKVGVLLMLLSEVEVEALPADLPDKIEIDVSKLSEVDQELKVADLHVPDGVTILSDAAVSVVKIGALVSKEAEEQAAAEAAAAQEAAAPAEGETAPGEQAPPSVEAEAPPEK